jgi:hypothetical protein
MTNESGESLDNFQSRLQLLQVQVLLEPAQPNHYSSSIRNAYGTHVPAAITGMLDRCPGSRPLFCATVHWCESSQEFKLMRLALGWEVAFPKSNYENSIVILWITGCIITSSLKGSLIPLLTLGAEYFGFFLFFFFFFFFFFYEKHVWILDKAWVKACSNQACDWHVWSVLWGIAVRIYWVPTACQVLGQVVGIKVNTGWHGAWPLG